MWARSSRRVTGPVVARLAGSISKGDPASHRAQSLSPRRMTLILAALTSSGDPICAPGPCCVPKPPLITPPAPMSARRLGVSTYRADSVTPSGPIRNLRIRPSPSNQWVALPLARRNLAPPLRNSVPARSAGAWPRMRVMGRGARSWSRSAKAILQSAATAADAAAAARSGVNGRASIAPAPSSTCRRRGSERVAMGRLLRKGGQSMSMVWAPPPGARSKATSAQLGARRLMRALLEKATGSVGMPNGFRVSLPVPLRSWNSLIP